MFSNVAFRHAEIVFAAYLLKNNCGRVLRTATCFRNVIGGMQGHVSCKQIVVSINPPFMTVEFHGDDEIATKLK